MSKSEEVKEVKKTKHYEGIPMSEESKAEWEFAFLEIEENIENLKEENDER